MKAQTEEQHLRLSIHKKIDDYISGTGDVITKEDKEAFVSTLLAGRNVDVGGVVAIRGFIYQYYVAAKYLVEMLFSEKAWWDKVIFELLDDITLWGKTDTRFIQVKTKRDSNTDNHLNLSELHERKKNKGSWLDKLFLLNLHTFDSKQNVLERNDNHLMNYNFQFELATNSVYHENVAVYGKNDDFKSDVKKEYYEKLKKKY